jgi:hypothetical protein
LSFAFTERFLDPVYAPNRLFGQGMLQDADDFPSVFLEYPVNSAVTTLVGDHLGIPELRICLWTGVARRASMPKTAVNKHNHTLSGEAEVRSSYEAQVPAPPFDAG